MVVATAAGTLATAGCGDNTASCPRDGAGLPLCAISAEFISQRPGAKLVYPGATVVSTTARGEVVGIDSTSESTVDRVLSTTASLGEVVTWYQSQLAPQGWTTAVASAEAGGFNRGREGLYISPSSGAGADSSAHRVLVTYTISARR
jgi:hypothetical protein